MADGLVVLREAWTQLDRNNDGKVSRIEFIQAVRQHPEVARVFDLPSNIRQEDGSRDLFERVFQSIDANSDQHLTWEELQQHHLAQQRAAAAAAAAELPAPAPALALGAAPTAADVGPPPRYFALEDER